MESCTLQTLKWHANCVFHITQKSCVTEGYYLSCYKMLSNAHSCLFDLLYGICHKVNYLDNTPVGLPSGAAHTQCTVYLQSPTDSGTALWTVTDKDIYYQYNLFCLRSHLHRLFSDFLRLAAHHVAVRCQGVLWVAVTGLTASVLTVVPVVRSTLVTVMADDILPARAGSSLLGTVTVSVTARRLHGSSSHTSTTWEQKGAMHRQQTVRFYSLYMFHSTGAYAEKNVYCL